MLFSTTHSLSLSASPTHPVPVVVHTTFSISMWRWWCVLVTLPVLLASTQGPSYSCCYNSTLVAGEPLDPASLGLTNTPSQVTSSVVDSGKFCILLCSPPFSSRFLPSTLLPNQFLSSTHLSFNRSLTPLPCSC